VTRVLPSRVTPSRVGGAIEPRIGGAVVTTSRRLRRDQRITDLVREPGPQAHDEVSEIFGVGVAASREGVIVGHEQCAFPPGRHGADRQSRPRQREVRGDHVELSVANLVQRSDGLAHPRLRQVQPITLEDGCGTSSRGMTIMTVSMPTTFQGYGNRTITEGAVVVNGCPSQQSATAEVLMANAPLVTTQCQGDWVVSVSAGAC
jgi:hypothetical protein